LSGLAAIGLSKLKWALFAFLGILVLWAMSKPGGASADRQVRDLVKSAHMYSATAMQDTNPIFALMHANYARAYLNVARTIGSDAQVELAAGQSLERFMGAIDDAENQMVARMNSVCNFKK
jgi:hypothetical protein